MTDQGYVRVTEGNLAEIAKKVNDRKGYFLHASDSHANAVFTLELYRRARINTEQGTLHCATRLHDVNREYVIYQKDHVCARNRQSFPFGANHVFHIAFLPHGCSGCFLPAFMNREGYMNYFVEDTKRLAEGLVALFGEMGQLKGIELSEEDRSGVLERILSDLKTKEIITQSIQQNIDTDAALYGDPFVREWPRVKTAANA